MRIGIAASMRAKTDTSWDESADYVIDLAKYGDEHGYSNIWMTEHHFTEELMAGSGPIFGTRDEVIDQIRELERIGVKHISVSFAFKSPIDVSRRRAERFTEEVLPHVT